MPEPLMLVQAGADTSILDVSMGQLHGLKENHIDVREYSLYRRLQMAYDSLNALKPEGTQVDQEQVCLLASEPLLHRAVIEGCRWVLVISGLGLHPNALVALRKCGIKVAIYFTEAPYSTKEDEELYLTNFADIAFTNERTCLSLFKSKVENSYYIPHSYNELIHKPVEVLEEDLKSDVCFVGTGFRERIRLLESIDFTGINLAIGGIWYGLHTSSFLKQYIKYDRLFNYDTIKLYHNTKIAINLHRESEHAESANPRVFEIAACKVFQISDYRKEIEDIFGDSIPMYDPCVPWQLESLMRYYLEHEEERLEKAEKAYNKVQGLNFGSRSKIIIEAINNFKG